MTNENEKGKKKEIARMSMAGELTQITKQELYIFYKWKWKMQWR